MPTVSKDRPNTDSATELTPMERLTKLIERYQPEDDVIPEEGEDDPSAYVEGNPLLFVVASRTGAPTWLTLHHSAEEASECWAAEECPEYWDPTCLIDLRTGEELVALERSVVSFVPADTLCRHAR